METFTEARPAVSAPLEKRGTIPTARGREGDTLFADFSEDRRGISAERWRAWEEKIRLRRKANARKITVAVSASLLVLWMIGVITNYTAGGFIHILLLAAVFMLVIHVLQSRRSILNSDPGQARPPHDHGRSSDRPRSSAEIENAPRSRSHKRICGRRRLGDGVPSTA